MILVLAVGFTLLAVFTLWRGTEKERWGVIGGATGLGIVFLFAAFWFGQGLTRAISEYPDGLDFVISNWLPEIVAALTGAILCFAVIPFGLWRVQRSS